MSREEFQRCQSGHRRVEGAAQPSALSSSGQIPTLQGVSQQKNLIPLSEGERCEGLCGAPVGMWEGFGMWSQSWELSKETPLKEGWEGGSPGPAALQALVASLHLGFFNRKPKKKPFPTFPRCAERSQNHDTVQVGRDPDPSELLIHLPPEQPQEFTPPRAPGPWGGALGSPQPCPALTPQATLTPWCIFHPLFSSFPLYILLPLL